MNYVCLYDENTLKIDLNGLNYAILGKITQRYHKVLLLQSSENITTILEL